MGKKTEIGWDWCYRIIGRIKKHLIVIHKLKFVFIDSAFIILISDNLFHFLTKTYSLTLYRLCSIFSFLFPFYPHLKTLFFTVFLERKEGKERSIYVRERHWLVASCNCPDQGLNHSLGMCPGWASNLQTFGYRMTLQATEPHQPGLFSFLMCKTIYLGMQIKVEISVIWYIWPLPKPNLKKGKEKSDNVYIRAHFRLVLNNSLAHSS